MVDEVVGAAGDSLAGKTVEQLRTWLRLADTDIDRLAEDLAAMEAEIAGLRALRYQINMELSIRPGHPAGGVPDDVNTPAPNAEFVVE